jgi:hypothetical protein
MADNYTKGSSIAGVTGKTVSTGTMEMTKGGGSGGNMSGPTGSSRMYPKGALRVNDSLNPMDCPTTTIYVGGV